MEGEVEGHPHEAFGKRGRGSGEGEGEGQRWGEREREGSVEVCRSCG
jgi:hypothetical protein